MNLVFQRHVVNFNFVVTVCKLNGTLKRSHKKAFHLKWKSPCIYAVFRCTIRRKFNSRNILHKPRWKSRSFWGRVGPPLFHRLTEVPRAFYSSRMFTRLAIPYKHQKFDAKKFGWCQDEREEILKIIYPIIFTFVLKPLVNFPFFPIPIKFRKNRLNFDINSHLKYRRYRIPRLLKVQEYRNIYVAHKNIDAWKFETRRRMLLIRWIENPSSFSVEKQQVPLYSRFLLIYPPLSLGWDLTMRLLLLYIRAVVLSQSSSTQRRQINYKHWAGRAQLSLRHLQAAILSFI